MEEKINELAGKVLLQIYILYKKTHKIPNFNKLLDETKLQKEQLQKALEYCNDKEFLEIKIIKLLSGDKIFNMQKITSKGIDLIEKPKEKFRKSLFNLTFNTNFNIENIIKGEMKLF